MTFSEKLQIIRDNKAHVEEDYRGITGYFPTLNSKTSYKKRPYKSATMSKSFILFTN